MAASPRLLGLVLACASVACVSPTAGPSRGRARPVESRSGDAIETRLTELEDEPARLVAWVDDERRHVHDDETLAEMDLARARALSDLGREHSALAGLARAWAHVEPDVRGVGGEIQLAWAEQEFLAGDPELARDRLVGLLEQRNLDRPTRAAAAAVLVVVYEHLGDDEGAARWSSALGVRGHGQIRLARRRLVAPMVADPAPVVVRGGIPNDPRELLSEIRPRRDWSAAAMGPNKNVMTPITAVTVHHSAMPRSASAPGQIRTIQSMHQGDRGWADIGYHFIVDAQGGIWEARPLRWQGAHAGDSSSNRGNVGVCLLGDFDHQWVTPSQQEALLRLLDALRGRFGLECTDVWPHQHYRNTACPGEHLMPIVDAYRAG